MNPIRRGRASRVSRTVGRTRPWRCVVKSVFLLFAVPVSMHAHAILLPCAFGGLPVVPAQPSTADTVQFRLSWLIPLNTLGQQVFERTTVSNGSPLIELIFAESDAPIEGFRHIGSSNGQSYPSANDDSYTAAVGPFAAGTQEVKVKVFRRQSGAVEEICNAGGPPFVVAQQSVPAPRALVVEFYHPGLDHYFITQDPAEIADLDGGVHPGWTRTGQAFSAYVSGASGNRGVAACRWYAAAAGIDSHFFSASSNECRAMPSFEPTWQQETTNAFEIALPDLVTGACPQGSVPVYRLWNGRADSNHRYTTDPAIKAEMIAKGYIAEGYGPERVAMCSPSP